MNKEQGDKLLNLCNKFCKDNEDNRINTWSSGLFIRIMQEELSKVFQEDIKREIEIKKKINSFKEQITAVEATDVNPGEKQVKNIVSDETQKKVIDMVEKKKENPKKDNKR